MSDGTVTAASLLSLSGGDTFNLDSTDGSFTVVIQNDAGLIDNQAYTLTLASASAGTSFLRNGSAWNATTNPFTAADFAVVSGSGTNFFANVGLRVSGSSLQLTLTPVPEPATVGLVAAAGLLLDPFQVPRGGSS